MVGLSYSYLRKKADTTKALEEINELSRQEKKLIGKKFNRLFVIKTNIIDEKGKKHYLCKCDCGDYCVVEGNKILSGHTKSCGCLQKEESSKVLINIVNNHYHGLYGTDLYNKWSSMKRRCYNPTQNGYKNYGGRGIIMCDEWKNDVVSFYNWAMANGYQKGLEIDRIDVNGNYEPSNCRFVSHKENCNNKRRSKE